MGGQPFAEGPSNRPVGRRGGSRDKKTLAAAVPLEGEAEALTRRAVELVISALAAGFVTPGEAGTIPAGIDTFVRAIETSDFERRLQILEAELPARPEEVAELFDAGNRGYSIDRRESALNSR